MREIKMDRKAMQDLLKRLWETCWGFLASTDGAGHCAADDRLENLLRDFKDQSDPDKWDSSVMVISPGMLPSMGGLIRADRLHLAVFIQRSALDRAVVFAALRKHFGFTKLADDSPSNLFCLTDPRWHCERLNLLDANSN
jgi:hypothetical protein